MSFFHYELVIGFPSSPRLQQTNPVGVHFP